MKQLERVFIGAAASIAAALCVAWIAFRLQQEQFAPAVLFPLGVGAVLGGAIALIRRGLKLPGTWGALALSAGCGLLAVVGQDYFGHRHRAQVFERQAVQSHPLAAALVDDETVRPTLTKHLRARISNQPVWWTLDVLLVAGATVAVAGIAGRVRPQADNSPGEIGSAAAD